MKSDDQLDPEQPFDRELRSTLDALAREPAPDRLVARVASIPDQEPAMQPFRSRFRLSMPSLGPGFAVVLGVVAIALVAVVLRPALDGKPGGPGSSSVAVVPTASSTPTSLVPASVAPSTVATASPSTVPAPVGFEPVSVTFVSANDGWVLGSVACGTGRCAAIERTSDGGRTWASAPAPKTAVLSSIGPDVGGTGGIARIRFATLQDGWAFGPDLWATHNGGATWTKLSVAGLPAGSTVVALETSHGAVHAAFYDGAQAFRVATSPVGGDGWIASPLSVAIGAGPVPSIQLVLSGDTGWLLENDREVVAGARLVAGTWRTWTPPCVGVAGPAYLAASSATRLIASCDVGLWSSPTGNHLFASGDGGSTFAQTGSAVPVTMASGAATPNSSTIVVAGFDSQGSSLAGSFDGGKTWSTLLSAGAVDIADLGFTTTTQGVVVTTTTADGSGRLLMTRDGGHTWTAVAF